jgi:hypothetical protein
MGGPRQAKETAGYVSLQIAKAEKTTQLESKISNVTLPRGGTCNRIPYSCWHIPIHQDSSAVVIEAP